MAFEKEVCFFKKKKMPTLRNYHKNNGKAVSAVSQHGKAPSGLRFAMFVSQLSAVFPYLDLLFHSGISEVLLKCHLLREVFLIMLVTVSLLIEGDVR